MIEVPKNARHRRGLLYTWELPTYSKMMSLDEKEKKFIDEFQTFPSWKEKYERLIRMGQQAAGLEESQKTSEALVKGCQSQVWLHAKLNEHGQVIFSADSDALIVKGLVSLLVQVFSNERPEVILQSPFSLIEKIGLSQNLSPSRSNGLFSMVKQMKNFALAFSMIQRGL